MPNPFSNLLTTGFKQVHTDMINSVLEAAGCGRTCRLVYTGTKWQDCVDCPADPIGNKPGSFFGQGARTPIHASVPGCAVCEGVGKIPSEATEEVTMYIIWDSFAGADPTLLGQDDIMASNHRIKTLCAMNLMPQLAKTSEVIIDTSLEKYIRYRFTRVSEPKPVGFRNEWVVVEWERSI